MICSGWKKHAVRQRGLCGCRVLRCQCRRRVTRGKDESAADRVWIFGVVREELKGELPFAAELNNFPPVAFGWSTRRQLFKLVKSFALGCNLQPLLTAGIGFAVERLSDCSWSADFAQ